jgi:aspartate-semialdehyde dehydrogenase
MSGAKIPVGVLGATGSVGQRFVSLLATHPWFEIAALTASERSAGQPYGEAAQWFQEQPLPEAVAAMEVLPTAAPLPCRLLFSALDAAAADVAEDELARAGHFVVSNAKSHRMDPDVPLVVPEVNPDHLDLVSSQNRGGGAIVTNPNCSTIGLVLALKPLADAFGISAVHVVTMQALSGAGIPGVPSLAAVDNLIPYIPGEEEKVEAETRKILGRLNGAIDSASIEISAQCNRVAVIDGHTECVSVRFERPAALADVRAALASFTALPQELGLPMAPVPPIVVTDRPDRPQPRLDRGVGRGMAVTVGRLRPCPVFDVKFVALSHNTLRGAAGGSILVAELAVARGLVPGVRPPAA